MILAASVLFVVILSATAVSAIDNAGDFVADEFANPTDGADPIDVSDSVDLDNPLDVPDTGGPSNQASENGSASMNNSGASSSPFIIASIVLVLLSGTVAARKYRGRIVNTHKERE